SRAGAAVVDAHRQGGGDHVLGEHRSGDGGRLRSPRAGPVDGARHRALAGARRRLRVGAATSSKMIQPSHGVRIRTLRAGTLIDALEKVSPVIWSVSAEAGSPPTVCGESPRLTAT